MNESLKQEIVEALDKHELYEILDVIKEYSEIAVDMYESSADMWKEKEECENALRIAEFYRGVLNDLKESRYLHRPRLDKEI